MDSYQETFETWNKLAPLYQEKFMNMDLYNATYDYFCSSVAQPKAKILEIGCGPGNATHYLLAQRPDFDLFGTDIAPNMVALAAKNNPSARFAVMDCRHIGSLAQGYDGIIGGFCLPYLSQAEGAVLIADAHRLLNEKGALYLSFVEGRPDQSGYKTGSGGRVYFYYHPLEDVLAQLDKASFGNIKTFRVPYKTSEKAHEEHTIVIAQRKSVKP